MWLENLNNFSALFISIKSTTSRYLSSNKKFLEDKKKEEKKEKEKSLAVLESRINIGLLYMES